MRPLMLDRVGKSADDRQRNSDDDTTADIDYGDGA